jgi:putative pyruvate formate lyase activating enzyme|uniref:Radical SAM protein n=1 Tax=Desulfobacca acetoxidans TaxID=60893 RepID=A0A7C5EWL1_9BACT
MWEPVYLETYRLGLLDGKIQAASDILNQCTLCPHRCMVDRHHGERGLCRTGDQPVVSSYGPHFGEEDPLVGRRGSGTIFFTHCNLFCIFCQNWEISHGGEGEEITARDLAAIMVYLQKQGCHNINFVTPSHQVAQILEALPYAIEGGLNVPLVYNTGGYDAVETLKILDGVIDIYMPDFKFWDPEVAGQLCAAADYPEVARAAFKEMYRQVGDLVLDENGIAQRGLLVRHLVLPDNLAGTREVMKFLAEELSPNTYVNVMAQYRPCGRAFEHPSLNRFPTQEELAQAHRAAREAGLTRLDRREKLFRWL